jgi:DNA-directed RNA polymerase subunit A'
MAQSICTHKIRVATKANTDTIDINAIAANPLYNADFDGDEMNLIIITNQVSLAEAQYVSTIYNRIISGQSAKIAIAQYQDSIIGGYFMTKDVVTMDRMFCIRMH